MTKLLKSGHDIRVVAPWTSLRKLGRQYLKDQRLQTLLDRYATYTGSDPRKAPAALATVPYVEQEFGAWHIGGGVSELGIALKHRCDELGVNFYFNSDVTRIIVENGKAVGILLADDSEHRADVVVANADASEVYTKLLPRKKSKSARRRLRRATPSLSGFVLLLALDGRTPELNHHNVWFPANYDAEFDSVFGAVDPTFGYRTANAKPVIDPTIYVCAPDDNAMRPNADCESWFVLVNAPRHGNGKHTTVDWNEPGVAAQYAEHLLDVMQSRGIDIRSRIRWMEYRSPADLEAATRAPGGAIYGTSSNGPTAAFLRATNRSPVEDLYLVGGSAHPGGGIPLVGMSAAIVAELIRKRENKN